MKPWKSTPQHCGAHDDCLLQWGHGDEAVEELESEESKLGTNWLQWGHGDEAVEEDAKVPESLGHSLASMGPRR